MKKVWYVEFPTYQYVEDVKAIARKNDLQIVDARFDVSEHREIEENPPKLTKIGGPAKDSGFAILKKEADALGVTYSHQIGYEKLLERVEEARAEQQ